MRVGKDDAEWDAGAWERRLCRIILKASRAPMYAVGLGSEGDWAVLALGRTESALSGPALGQGRRPTGTQVTVTVVE